MRNHVQDVIQMEEGQRLLSKANRGRRQVFEQLQPPPRESPADRSVASTAKEAGVVAGDATDESRPARRFPTDSAPVSAAAGVLDDSSDALLPVDIGFEMATDGALDVKEQLEKQRKEKSEILSKLRGIHQSILELSDGAAVEVVRTQIPTSHQVATKTDGSCDTVVPDDLGGPVTDGSADRGLSSFKETGDNLEMIRQLRSTLKEMLDAHRAPFESEDSTYSCSGRRDATELLFPGSAWLAQDATYRPPAPPRTFSTNAFAVTLEYLSRGIACIIRIADEMCVATTFRARTDRVILLPHLSSLQKWMQQVECCLETAERHLRHFTLGETALVEDGAFEINSLREQTLLLRDSLTAQEQKLKTLLEARSAVLHRLRNLNKCCYLWETHLLHRIDTVHGDAAVPVGSNVGRSGSGSAFACFAAPTPTVMSLLGETDVGVGTNVTSVPDVCLGAPLLSTVATPVHTEAHSMSPRRKETSFSMATNAYTLPRYPTMRNRPPERAKIFSSTTSQRHSFSARSALSQTSPSTSTGSLEASATSTLQQIEERVARTWCNPYVRKRHLRERAEQAFEQEQLLRAQAAVEQWSLVHAHTSGSAERSSFDHRTSGTGCSPILQSGNFMCLGSARLSRSISATSDIDPTADAVRGRPSLVRLTPVMRIGRISTNPDVMSSISRLGDLATMTIPESSNAVEESLSELADMRVIQLLQGFANSIPDTGTGISDGRATGAGECNPGGNDGDDSAATSRLSYSLRGDVKLDESLQAQTLRSMLRIRRYLTLCSTRLERPTHHPEKKN
ncbi:hypothetical protein JKF63_02566 [Porcisia hertigi]|uniref:Uncharacterized protein n=1 Tax=Porcisia hertigi TaxID=2761500 RepID=A0A836L6B4_9TRYP|nr:hypothetical protein JKF63_02566 [Porcisia hertigi]